MIHPTIRMSCEENPYCESKLQNVPRPDNLCSMQKRGFDLSSSHRTLSIEVCAFILII